MTPAEKEKVKNALEKSTQLNVTIPKLGEISDDVENTPKGKVKSLLRKFEVKLQGMLNKNLLHINKQLDGIHSALFSQLDKKYGGMYKTLITTFLTNIESKIYNNEITIESLRRVFKEELQTLHEKNVELQYTIKELSPEEPLSIEDQAIDGDETAKPEEVAVDFGLVFEQKMLKMRKVVHKEVDDAKKSEVKAEKETDDGKEKTDISSEDSSKDNDSKESSGQVPDDKN